LTLILRRFCSSGHWKSDTQPCVGRERCRTQGQWILSSLRALTYHLIGRGLTPRCTSGTWKSLIYCYGARSIRRAEEPRYLSSRLMHLMYRQYKVKSNPVSENQFHLSKSLVFIITRCSCTLYGALRGLAVILGASFPPPPAACQDLDTQNPWLLFQRLLFDILHVRHQPRSVISSTTAL
jgi:hypothetical protein